MFLERPKGPVTLTRGGVPGLDEIYDAAVDAARVVDNVNGRSYALEQAYNQRIDAIALATGEKLDHPLLMPADDAAREFIDTRDPQALFDAGGGARRQAEREAEFRQRLAELAERYPDKRDIIQADVPVLESARGLARDAEGRLGDLLSRRGGVVGMGTAFAGGFRGMLEDPLNVSTMWIGAGNVAKSVLWNAVKMGAINAGIEAGMQPFVQAWRAEAGLDYGLGQAATNVGMAFAFGAGLDAAGRGAVRGYKRATGRHVEYDDPTLDLTPDMLLEDAARARPEGDTLRRAVEGDADALIELADDVRDTLPDDARGALEALRASRDLETPPIDVDDGAHLAALAQALRHAQRPDLEPPAPPVPGRAVPGRAADALPDLTDDAPAPVRLGQPFEVQGRPVTFEAIDPRAVTVDAATFQFKGGADGKGVTDRLRGVTQWDPIAAGKAVVYERADGTLVIADGHQRHGLATRLAREGAENVELAAYRFREADGWSPAEVRALAAKKNLQEGSGTPLDAAKVIRQAPEMLDGSVPLRSNQMRQARHLAQLSDEAFGAAVAEVVKPRFAALIGEMVPDKNRHAGILFELAQLDPQSTQQARLMVGDLMQMPTTTETQLTLLGELVTTRSVLRERAQVLDTALREMRKDARVFGMLEREGGRIEAEGNRLNTAANEAREREAAQLGELIEKLARQTGPVSDMLNRAARAVTEGTPITKAAESFSRSVRERLEGGGLDGLLTPELNARALDDPAKGAEQFGGDLEQALFSIKGDRKGAQDAAHAAADDLGFYSQALAGARGLQQKRGTPEQMLAQLKKAGVKDAEINATGLQSMLSSRQRVTKDEIVEFLADSQMRVNERVRYHGTMARATVSDAQRAEAMADRGDLTEFQDYSLDPKNETYVETVLSLPEREAEAMGGGYETSHFPEKNIVVHLMSSTVEHDGQPVHLIDQIQSDWGQELRQRDALFAKYGGEEKAEEAISVSKARRVAFDKSFAVARERAIPIVERAGLKAVHSYPTEDLIKRVRWIALDDTNISVEPSVRDEARQFTDEIGEALLAEYDAVVVEMTDISKLESALSWPVPRHPLVESTDQWVGVGLRRALRQAVENGAEFLAIPSGRTVLNYNEGGEHGMRVFYDKIVPGNYKKYIGKIDKAAAKAVAVEVLKTPGQGDAGHGFLLFPITDKVRATVMTGQALFSVPRIAAPSTRPVRPDLMTELRPALDEVVARLPEGVRVRLEDRLTVGRYDLDGMYQADEALVWVALSSDNPARVARHEEVHVLRDLGLISRDDWRLLTDYARQNGLRDEFGIEQTYREAYAARTGGDEAKLEDLLDEETVAEMWARYDSGERFGGAIDRVIELVQQVLRQIRDALGLQGYRTVQDVFADIGSGRMAAGQRPEPDGATARALYSIRDEIKQRRDILRQAETGENLIDGDGVADGAAGSATGRADPDALQQDAQRRADLADVARNRRELGRDGGEPADVLWNLLNDAMRNLDARGDLARMPFDELRRLAVGDLMRMEEFARFTDTPAETVRQYARDIDAMLAEMQARHTRQGGDIETVASDLEGTLNRTLDDLVSRGMVPVEEADEIKRTFGALVEETGNPDQAMDDLIDRIEAEADQRARRALLTERIRARLEEEILTHRNARGESDPGEAVMAVLEHFGLEGGAVTRSVEGARKAILGMAHANMEHVLHEFRQSAVAGRRMNRARLDNVVRELFGEATGDQAAAGLARAWTDTAESLRQRFNAAGGAIGQLQDWGLPQMHDGRALRRAGLEEWRRVIRPLLDTDRMRNPLTGQRYTPREMDEALEHVWRTITTEGWSNQEPSGIPTGRGALANQHADHRFLHFKDADAWMEYQRAFGQGDAFAAMMGHVSGMARDIAFMEQLGPNPKATLEWMVQIVEREGALAQAGLPARFPTRSPITGQRIRPENHMRRARYRVEAMYDHMRGNSSMPVNEGLADTMATVRNVNVATKLGSAVWSALTDTGFQWLHRRYAGLPSNFMRDIVGGVARQFATGNRREAVRAGLIMDSALMTMGEQARYAGSLGGKEWSAYLADRVLTLTGLSPWTQAGRHAFGMEFMGLLADNAGRTFDQLDGRLQRTFARYGIDASVWDVARAAPLHRPRQGSAGLLRPRDIPDRAVAERLLEMIIQETEYAVPSGTVRARSLVLGKTRPGSFLGELVRSGAQFKAFGVTVTLLHMSRVAQDLGAGHRARGFGYAFAFLATTAIGGALALQLKQIIAGRDPRDMTTPEFAGAAMLQGGGLGIYGDFFFADQSRFDQSLAVTLGGPTMGVANDALKLTVGNLQRAARGEDTKFAKDAVRFGNSHLLPSAWYTKLAWERLGYETLQRLADPDANAAFRRRVRKYRREYDQAFWWKPGRRAPDRAPALGLGR